MRINSSDISRRRGKKPGRPVRPLLASFAFTLLMLALTVAPLAAQNSSQGRLSPPPKVEMIINGDPSIVIRADDIEGDRNRSIARFIGNVSIIRGNETIIADQVVWHELTNTAELSGNIRITAPDFIVIADRGVVNLDTSMAKIYNGKAFFPAQNYYLSGAVVERLGERVMQVTDGTATTCDGPNPSWTIHASHLTVTEGGYASATGVSLNTRYFPILATPYFFFPVKNERQSGLLTPFFSSSTRDGFKVSLPVFWATGENHDLTFTPVWRDKRGLAGTLEARYHLQEGKGIWQFTYLDDKKHDTYAYNNSNIVKEAKQRYWLRAQNMWHLNDWDINLDLDLVSDPLFLKTFRDDIDGFNTSSRIFSNEFGRTLNEYLDPVRTNTLYAQKTGYDSMVRGTLDYSVNLYSRNNSDTLQRLPSIRYNIVSRALSASEDSADLSVNKPRFSLDMRYDYFYRTTNENSPTDETGHRTVLSPSMEWSTPVGGLATLNMEGQLGLNMYAPDGHRYSADSALAGRDLHDSTDSSLSGSFTASLSTTLSRIYQGGPRKAVGTRHQVIPTIELTYTKADKNQRDLPYWDFLDRQLSRRTVRYGFLNTFTSKTPVANPKGDQPGYNYFQFLKVGIWGSYEFVDNQQYAEDKDARYSTIDYFDKGAGPIELEMEAFFNPHFSLRAISAMDGRSGEFVSHDISLRLRDTRGDYLTLTYDRDVPSITFGRQDFATYEEIRAGLGLKLTQELSANVATRYDLRQKRTRETHAQLLYSAQCYNIGLLFTNSEDDKSVGLIIDLLGLGGINQGFGNLVDSPGRFSF